MSIYFDFDVGPSRRRFRRAIDADKAEILLFWKPEDTALLFGEVDISILIEVSTLSICMINERKEVLGFMALSDHPPVPAVDPSSWTLWIRTKFDRHYRSRNTLFISFICCKDEVLEFFLNEAFITVFDSDSYLNNIVLFVPHGCPKECYSKYPVYMRYGVRHYRSLNDIEHSELLITAIRQEFIPKLKMRRAVEEDNDDILSILDKLCPIMKDIYGEYYISEMVGRHPNSGRKIIVGELEDRAVGVMCLNSTINYELLQTLYELKPLYGLRKAYPLVKEQLKRRNPLITTFGRPILLGKFNPFGETFHVKKSAFADDDEEPVKTKSKVRKSSRINIIRYSSRSSVKTPRHSNYEVKSLGRASEITWYMGDLLEEDPFEYEIVNIDDDLLKIPEPISSDMDLCSYSGPELLMGLKRRKLSIIQHRRSRKSRPDLHFAKNETAEKIVYSGEPSAFAIELFALQEDMHERNIFEFLVAAFEVMKEFDYCIIRVPYDEQASLLLQHFTYVPTRGNLCGDYALYVAHRSAVLGEIRVREAELLDIPQIANLMHNFDGTETLWSIENAIMRETQSAFVLQSGASVVGYGLLEPSEEIDFIRAKFNMDSHYIHKHHMSHTTCGFTALKTMVAYNVFQQHFRFFAREMLRMSGHDTMLWITAYRHKWTPHKANSMVSSMVPLLPRKSENERSNSVELKIIRYLSENVMPFTPWFMSKKYCSVPMAPINTRIVVIGASSTSMAFLDSLLFSATSTYLSFTNVTLISMNGLPYVSSTNHPIETMFPRLRTTSEQYLKSVPYTYYVNVVEGLVVEIDRQNRMVILSNGSKCYYDMLFLTFGKQYQHPNYFKDVLARERKFRDGTLIYKRLDIPSYPEEIRTFENVPENVFIVNNPSDANKALGYVRSLTWKNFRYQIIVYGASIHAYCCIEALLEMNVPPENINFVESFPPEDPKKTRVPMFCNVYIDQTMRETLNRLRINVYRSYYFKNWTVDSINRVTQVEFLSHFKMVTLDCSVFFYYGKRGINPHAFVAIHKSGIGYDGGILIDHEFRTKDPRIYAAGPCTRYYRRYFAESKRQRYYDSYDVGEKLGQLIRNKLDPLFSTKGSQKIQKNKSPDSNNKVNYNASTSRKKPSLEVEKGVLPVLKKPLVINCTLPGGLQYLEVRSPGLKIPHYYVQSLAYNGYIMETYKDGYFKLHVSSNQVVDGITCLCAKDTSLENFKNLYGLSTVALNNVHLRYAAKKILSFYEFFSQPWCYYLYIDKGVELFAMVKELLPKGEHDVTETKTLREALHMIGDRLTTNNCYKFDWTIRSKFEKSHHMKVIMDYVLEWVSENEVILPMYLYPALNVYFTHDLGTHPAFKKKEEKEENNTEKKKSEAK